MCIVHSIAMWGAVFLLSVAGMSVLADPSEVVPAFASGLGGASRILSGWDAEEGQFPHMIFLRLVDPDGLIYSCGGTIIHAEWGLTAAHCTSERSYVIINAGSVNRNQPLVFFETNEWYNHPLFNESDAGRVQPNDIGVIKFGRTLVFSDTIRPIRIQRSEDSFHNYEGTVAVAAGWGRTWTDSATATFLQWVYLRIVSNAECLRNFPNNGVVQPSTICAGYYNVTSQSTCRGDSGSSLTVVDDDGAITQVGVTSFSSSAGCHLPIPTGFVRPGPYHAWFTEVTGINFDWKVDAGTDTCITRRRKRGCKSCSGRQQPESRDQRVTWPN